MLDKGKISEEGRCEQLIANNRCFAGLAERQRLDDTHYVGKTTLF